MDELPPPCVKLLDVLVRQPLFLTLRLFLRDVAAQVGIESETLNQFIVCQFQTLSSTLQTLSTWTC
jgi:hypothetical protein